VHYGHLTVARAAGQQLTARQVLLIPSARPPHKDPAVASAEDRLAMLDLAVGRDDLLAVSDIELDRPGRSYTIDTVRQLKQTHGPACEICWIIGADMLACLHKWHKVHDLLDEATIVPIRRAGMEEDIDALLGKLHGELTGDEIESLRRASIDTPLVEVSSSEIRRRLKQNQPVGDLLPEDVLTYIKTHGLYV
jgi:nicotinate-nucleotide adenylyltransferase